MAGNVFPPLEYGPLPTFNEVVAVEYEKSLVFPALIEDIKKRDQKGWEQHHKPLKCTDSHDWLWEAYEEVLDLAVYLKAELMRREAQRNEPKQCNSDSR